MKFAEFVPPAIKGYIERLTAEAKLADEDAACIQRLLIDERMRPAYEIIDRELSDRQQSGFFYAAWSARMNYRRTRERVAEADRLASQIAKGARALASSLRQFYTLGLCGPFEFYSVAALLETTPGEDRDVYMWPIVRGDLYRSADMKAAPSVAALLETLAAAASCYVAREIGHIDAAIATRQRNEKTEYLRALLWILHDVHDIPINPPVMKAAATAATVVIESPDMDVSYDDARKAAGALVRAGKLSEKKPPEFL
ncbi:MAG: hypothetical protein N2690_11560 [Rhodocyclaceae bacterium]|nr:hypothetical protein [Rhodocyclaceae bacterium]